MSYIPTLGRRLNVRGVLSAWELVNREEYHSTLFNLMREKFADSVLHQLVDMVEMQELHAHAGKEFSLNVLVLSDEEYRELWHLAYNSGRRDQIRDDAQRRSA